MRSPRRSATSSRLRHCTLAAATAACAAAALAPRAADAQVLQRFQLQLEGGWGAMIANEQRAFYGYDQAIQGSARLGFTIIGPLAIQAAYSSWLFPAPMGSGGVHMLGGGVRVEPAVSPQTRLFFDAHVMGAFTGGASSVGFDLAAGMEFYPSPWLGIGPVLRYGHVFATDAVRASDAQFLSAGFAVTLRVPPPPPPAPPPAAPPPPPPADADRDGVPDATDACASEPAGEHPEPARAGCPARDGDGDTVFDFADACPTTAQGEHPDPDRAGCPDGDADNDGVRDHADQCPTEAPGAQPDPARAGCPSPDRDHDMVPDAADRCPEQPGAPAPDAARNGCAGAIRVENGAIVATQPVAFDPGRATIRAQSTATLQAIADALRAAPAIRRVVIEAHTDEPPAQLSTQRAAAVRDWLVAHGVEAARLDAQGLAATRPLVPTTNLTGAALTAARARNRRVEFRITDPAPAAAPASATPAPAAQP